jgi:hypothetical protein
MSVKKVICLLLALVLVMACFAGCRDKKEEQQDIVEVLPPDGQEGLTADENPIEIVISEGAELDGDELP